MFISINIHPSVDKPIRVGESKGSRWLTLEDNGQSVTIHIPGEREAAIRWATKLVGTLEALVPAIHDHEGPFHLTHRPGCPACDALAGFRYADHRRGLHDGAFDPECDECVGNEGPRQTAQLDKAGGL